MSAAESDNLERGIPVKMVVMPSLKGGDLNWIVMADEFLACSQLVQD